MTAGTGRRNGESMAEPNYYEILEIPSDADEREIKRSYHRLARDLHPDKATSPEMAEAFQERFAQVSAAYNTLKDSEKRAEYDRGNKGGGSSSGGSHATGGGRIQRPGNATAAVLSAGRGVPGGGGGTATGTATTAQGSSSQLPQAARPALGLTPEKAQIAQKAFARGMQFYKENQFVKAIDFFEAAIQNNDTDPNYHARLALALIQARKSASRAIEAAQRAIDLDPYNMEHKFNLAFVFETIGSKTNAQKVYEEILKWDAGNIRATAAMKELKNKKGIFSPNYQPTPVPGSTAQGNAPEPKGGLLQQLLGRFKK